MNFFKFQNSKYKVSSLDFENITRGFLALSNLYQTKYFDLEESMKCNQKSLSLSKLKNHLELADLYNEIENWYVNAFKLYQSAISYYIKALDLYEKLLKTSNPSTYGNLALCYFETKNYKDCIDVNKRLIHFNTIKFGEKCKENIEVFSVIGDCNNLTQNYEEAANMYKQSIQIIEANIYDSKYEDLVYFTAMIGKTYFMYNQLNESLTYYKNAKDLIEHHRIAYNQKTTIEKSILEITKKISKN